MSSEKSTARLEAFMRALESRSGRVIFWTFVAVFGVALGAQTVVRAEIPKERRVERLRYTSPVPIGSRQDEQAVYHSSEFQGFRALSWGAVVEDLDQYTDLHTRGYPPFFAIAFFPFALFWRCPGVGSTLFFLTGYGGGLLAAWCLARWHRRKGERRPASASSPCSVLSYCPSCRPCWPDASRTCSYCSLWQQP